MSGQVLLDKRFDEIKDSIESGVVDETKAVGVLPNDLQTQS